METATSNPRKWYQKKQFVISLGFVALVAILMEGDTSGNVVTETAPAEIVTTVVPAEISVKSPEPTHQIETVTAVEEKTEPAPVVQNDKSEPLHVIPIAEPKPKIETIPKTAPKLITSNCHSGYSDCLRADASDYDCQGGSGNGPYYTGPVQVYGSDPFDLDRDSDGWGCE